MRGWPGSGRSGSGYHGRLRGRPGGRVWRGRGRPGGRHLGRRRHGDLAVRRGRKVRGRDGRRWRGWCRRGRHPACGRGLRWCGDLLSEGRRLGRRRHGPLRRHRRRGLLPHRRYDRPPLRGTGRGRGERAAGRRRGARRTGLPDGGWPRLPGRNRTGLWGRPGRGDGGGLRHRRPAAEVLPGRPYRGVVLTEHGGPGGGHAGVVAAGLVAVAELLGHRPQVEGDGQHQRLGAGPPALARRVRLLQHSTGGGRVVGLAVHPCQQVCGAQHLRVVLAVRGPDRGDRVGQQPAGGGQITGGTEGERPLLSGDEGGGL